MEGWVLLEVRKVGEGVWTLTLEISEERRAAREVGNRRGTQISQLRF